LWLRIGHLHVDGNETGTILAYMLNSPFAAIRRAGETLREDLAAARERDPAARNTAELVLLYPGLHAVWMHRAAHGLVQRGLHTPGRAVSQLARFLTGIEIHPGATIGRRLFIDHGMGVVVGETAEIGDDVTIYQGVTIGGTGKDSGKRHPTVGNGVIVGTGAAVLGPLTVGDGAKIGAGAIVVKDVPANATVVGNPGRPVTVNGQRVKEASPPGPDLEHTRLPDPIAEALSCLVNRVNELEQDVRDLREGRVPEERPGEFRDCLPPQLRAVLGLTGDDSREAA
jgi:serine O-acetyltransferase